MAPAANPLKPARDVDAKPAEAGVDRSRDGNQNPSPPPQQSSSASVADTLAQTLRDLARGEQTAATLEANLTNLENKLDAILASLGVSADDDGLAADDQDASRRSDGKIADGNRGE